MGFTAVVHSHYRILQFSECIIVTFPCSPAPFNNFRNFLPTFLVQDAIRDCYFNLVEYIMDQGSVRLPLDSSDGIRLGKEDLFRFRKGKKNPKKAYEKKEQRQFIEKSFVESDIKHGETKRQIETSNKDQEKEGKRKKSKKDKEKKRKHKKKHKTKSRHERHKHHNSGDSRRESESPIATYSTDPYILDYSSDKFDRPDSSVLPSILEKYDARSVETIDIAEQGAEYESNGEERIRRHKTKRKRRKIERIIEDDNTSSCVQDDESGKKKKPKRYKEANVDHLEARTTAEIYKCLATRERLLTALVRLREARLSRAVAQGDLHCPLSLFIFF
ncbi:unnamed protein product [Protopolystoma xenopodis]|uniref:Uncharacterized protein n=1 Tax=Protopolystoma xenopodis TaxID=117903 RepID=A0A3S5C6M6_9PLAT|nr:unnamed protein product [Protopolystoma xenopodis]